MKVLIIGGNRFFGRHLAELLLRRGAKVTLLNRGNLDDGFGDRVQRLKVDRKNPQDLVQMLSGKTWDLVYDQVCYTADEARVACELFSEKTRRYIVTSSESIYDYGSQLNESEFDPSHYHFDQVADKDKDYQEAKRQVETVFSHAPFEVAMVRPSLVVGLDDYTGRLKWHVERVARSLPIYFPNLEARSDFIRSDQAGRALECIGLSNHVGPINCTTPGTLSLREFISYCEAATGKKAHLANRYIGDNHSPYGGREEKSMDTNCLRSLGFSAPSSTEWMRDLIYKVAATL